MKLTRKKFKQSLKVLSSLSKTNIKDCHVEALLDVVEYSGKFIEIKESDLEGHIRITYKYDFRDEKQKPKLKDVLNMKL